VTTPLPSGPLVTALLEMVRAAVPSNCKIYLARAVQGAVPPYAVFYPDTGSKSPFERNVLNDAPRDLRYQVTSVGATPEQAAWVADKVAAALWSGVPTVTGRRVWPVIEEGSQPVRPDDESTGVFLATAQYLTRSDPT
jgi:hypothetical protein